MITRRNFLVGASFGLCLPEIMAAKKTPVQPKSVFVFIPNGIIEPWSAKGSFSSALDPLKSVQRQLLVLEGLDHHKAKANGDGAGDHARSGGTFLTGVQLRKSASQIRAAESIDQRMGRHLTGQTAFASLEFGAEKGRLAGSCDSGYSCAYSSNIAWRGPQVPAAKEVNPRLGMSYLPRGNPLIPTYGNRLSNSWSFSALSS